MTIPCGQCIGCRLDKTREWGIRCVHEAQMHNENSFITLTYNDSNLPEGATLRKLDFQKFIRSLRDHLGFKNGKRPILRYYMCGEYGDNEGSKEMGRPHYHALLFGWEPDDQIYHHTNGKNKVFTSALLEKLWGKGFTSVGSVDYGSAKYVARYVMKKINGKMADEIDPDTCLKHYERLDYDTGEIFSLLPEYTNMSLKPGIGYDWFVKYAEDVFPSDFVVIEGRECPTPAYYTTLLKQLDPALYLSVKARRKKSMDPSEQTWRRLDAKEACAEARLSQLKRPLQ